MGGPNPYSMSLFRQRFTARRSRKVFFVATCEIDLGNSPLRKNQKFSASPIEYWLQFGIKSFKGMLAPPVKK